MNDWSPYSYTATVVSIYDADTLNVRFDLGFKIGVNHRVRLHGIDAWEVRSLTAMMRQHHERAFCVGRFSVS
jgi:endonuclease YncB( thermonuclease family)